ncbi:glycosyltransferase [Corynebacterium glutamicum]|uniref:glycosyltransferase n=1 Tax=Corynebacterium glutamicum TaxID=1718 RepID=UPI0004F6BB28|nr:glycosyltransferase [Corynebacterium glutamicum]AIK86877.1 hypothetical protein AR0_02305 [Corynebacterium glutamicum]
MKSNLIGWVPQGSPPLTEAMHALPYARGEKKIALAYTPVARMNPYQALLYSSCNDYGIAPTELIPFDTFKKADKLRGLADEVVVHFHWINSILATASDTENARWRVGKTRVELERLRDHGIKFAFTLHNKVSHDAKYIDAEIELQQAIIDHSDVIHSMSRAAITSMGDYASVPEDKVIYAPHPTYENVYSDFLSKAECRKALGVRPEEFVISLFGAIKPYKGLGLIMDRWREIANNSDVPLRLVIAGAPDKTKEAQDFVNWAILEPSVTIHPEKVPFEQVQLFVKSADAGIIPYGRTLNSGAALLHLTFGVPIIVVNEPALTEGIPSAVFETFNDGDDLPAAISNAVDRFADPDLTQDFLTLEQQRAPQIVSAEFSRGLISTIF